MDFGIVIPSYNDQHWLESLFESLYTNPAGATFLPVVVDDHSTDGTSEWLTETLPGYGMVIKPTEKSYFTRCCNAGINWLQNKTKPEFYFLLNSDTRVTPGWGTAIIATHHQFNAAIVGATCLNPDGTLQHAGGYGLGYHFDIKKLWVRYREDRIVPWVSGAAMCIHKSYIDIMPALPVQENKQQYDASDRDYCTTARLDYGIEVAVSAGCIIYHYSLASMDDRKKKGEYFV